MTKQDILQAQNNAKHYVYDLLGYFITDDFDVMTINEKSCKVYKDLNNSLEAIDNAVAFILKDMKKCDIIPRKKAM